MNNRKLKAVMATVAIAMLFGLFYYVLREYTVYVLEALFIGVCTAAVSFWLCTIYEYFYRVVFGDKE